MNEEVLLSFPRFGHSCIGFESAGRTAVKMAVGGMKDGGKEFALETEYFDFEAGKWNVGEPLPKGEVDSRLSV